MRLRLSLCLSLLLCACITPVDGLHKEQSFHYANVIEGGMLIGGVTATSKRLSPQVRRYYAELLRQSFQQKRPNYRLQGAGALENNLGYDTYHRLLDDYRNSRDVSVMMLKTLMQGMSPSMRYVVFARVERDDVTKQRFTHEEAVYQSNGDDSSSDHSDVTTLAYTNRIETWQTKRTLAVALQVYDVEQLLLVWRGSVNKTGIRTNEYTDQIYPYEHPALVKLNGIETRHYPTIVSTGRVLQWVMEGFGENMPRRDGRR